MLDRLFGTISPTPTGNLPHAGWRLDLGGAKSATSNEESPNEHDGKSVHGHGDH